MKDSTLCMIHGYFYALITVTLIIGFTVVGWDANGWDQYLCAGAAVFAFGHVALAEHVAKKEKKAKTARRAATSEEDSW